jgi:hypothetical protein
MMQKIYRLSESFGKERELMEQKTIRLLNANEIECRIGTISEKGLSLLLYKDARVDMKILDEVYGANNWQRKHEVIGNNLYCIVSIWDEDKKQWVSKMDVGTKSRTEMEKGESSDAFKRACVNWGIGRELYTAPFIWVGAAKCSIQNKDNRSITYDKFRVSSIAYNDNREITGLVIINQDGKPVYSLIDRTAGQQCAPVQMKKDGAEQIDERTVAINKELARTGVALDTVLERYGVSSLQEMSEATFTKAMNSLRRTKTAA